MISSKMLSLLLDIFQLLNSLDPILHLSLTEYRESLNTLRISSVTNTLLIPYQHTIVSIHSPSTTVQLLALQDCSSTELLLHPTCDPVYADNRVENYYDTLSSLLTEPTPGTILPPWSQPIDSVAPWTPLIQRASQMTFSLT
jgi:hypothetical protein